MKDNRNRRAEEILAEKVGMNKPDEESLEPIMAAPSDRYEMITNGFLNVRKELPVEGEEQAEVIGILDPDSKITVTDVDGDPTGMNYESEVWVKIVDFENERFINGYVMKEFLTK